MTSSIPIDDLPASKWWEFRRSRYNAILRTAIVTSWALMIWILVEFPESKGCLDGPLVIATVQLILAIFSIGIANLFYFLGPFTERIVHKEYVATYRVIAYRAGCIFSAALPMIVPLLTLFQAITGTTPSVECGEL